MKQNDCIPCHFTWEERELMRYLPPAYRVRLLRDHALLKRRNYPHKLLEAHAAWEEKAFHRFVPRPLWEQLAVEHARVRVGDMRVED